MKNQLLFFLIIFLFASTHSFSQDRITISGKVVDAESGEPLAFASIGIKGNSLSTVSNLAGEFDFHIPAGYKDGVFVINMIGYVDIATKIGSLPKTTPIIFKMEKAVQMLNEIVVQDSLTAEDIVKIAINKIPANHPEKPYLMECFYRDLKKVGGFYVAILEAAVKIYDQDYEAPRNKYRLREKVALTEVRRSLGYENKFTSYFEQTNLLEDLLLHNPVKYRHFPNDDEFYSSLKRMPDTYYNGHQVYVIHQVKGPQLKLFIDMDNYAFIRIENELDYDDLVLKSHKGLYSQFEYKKLILDFKRYKNKMYPKYMKVISKINWYNNLTDSLQFETELHQELLVNEIHPNSDERINNLRKMKKYGLQYQDLPYNEEFWKNYNVIKQTPLDKEIINDLKREGAMPTGYVDN